MVCKKCIRRALIGPAAALWMCALAISCHINIEPKPGDHEESAEGPKEEKQKDWQAGTGTNKHKHKHNLFTQAPHPWNGKAGNGKAVSRD